VLVGYVRTPAREDPATDAFDRVVDDLMVAIALIAEQ
jgi:hypothetical protein